MAGKDEELCQEVVTEEQLHGLGKGMGVKVGLVSYFLGILLSVTLMLNRMENQKELRMGYM